MDAVVLNINKFHLMNELYGHEFGDRLLCMVADIIKKILKISNGIACRCEADLFYIYTPHIDNYDDLLKNLSDELRAEANNSRIFLRMGLYENTDPETDIK